MKHRIFVALNIPQELSNKILKWENEFCRKAPETAEKIRWLAGESLHITIAPPWYEDDGGIERVKKALSFVSGDGIFDCFFENISYGPDPRRSRLIWLSGKMPPQLIDLKKRIMEALKAKSESRPFFLHLTIGRFHPNDFSSFSIKNLNEPFKFKETIGEFSLIKSRLDKNGARYEIMGKFKV